MPTKCPECSAPKERLFRYDIPTVKRKQEWLCAKCDHVWTPTKKGR